MEKVVMFPVMLKVTCQYLLFGAKLWSSPKVFADEVYTLDGFPNISTNLDNLLTETTNSQERPRPRKGMSSAPAWEKLEKAFSLFESFPTKRNIWKLS